jgi:uncharacterized protein YciI
MYPAFPWREAKMIFVVLFEDDASRAQMRTQHMPAHLAFLERNWRVIHAAGPLTDPADGSAGGGLWLVEADSFEEVKALYREDPFWPTGLRKSVRILEWEQVFAGGKCLL